MTIGRGAYKQAEQFALLAREHKLDADADALYGYRIGATWFTNPIDFSVALIVAFDKVGIPIPPELRKRPDDLYV